MATRANVAIMRDPALIVPRRLPATFDFAARAATIGDRHFEHAQAERATRICISMFQP